MQKERPPNREDFSADEGNVGSFLMGCAGAAMGLIAGCFLFAATYKPFTGVSGPSLWRVPLIDGLIILAVGTLAFMPRKKTAFLQGILISAALLFVVNGFCGFGGR